MSSKKEDANIKNLEVAVAKLISKSRSSKDLRMATNALNDLSLAFETFSPYQNQKKATIFGSARLKPGSTGYQVAYSVAEQLSEAGFLVITGGGPGVMHAGLKGAKAGRGIGIGIELPFEVVDPSEEKANGWPLARHQMFFTRKLALTRNVQAFIAAPGGFGTLDEFFEVLTLIQTGKAKPAPIVLLETPDNRMWSKLDLFIKEHLEDQGLIDPLDKVLYLITTSPEEAVEYVTKFWSNYVSLTVEDGRLSIHHQREISAETLALISQQRGVLSLPEVEGAPNDWVLNFDFDLRHWSDLHVIIDTLNRH